MIDLVISLISPFLFLYIVISQYKIAQSQHYEIRKYFRYNFIKKVCIQIGSIVIFGISFFVNKLDRVILLVFLLIIF